MANPTTLYWQGTTEYVDGSPFTAADLRGYEVEVNGLDAFAIPIGWNDNNTYSFPLVDLPNIKQGTNAVRMRTVAANGQASDWTDPVTFQWASVPKAPTQVVVA